jgi:hypothetical protein
MLSCQHYHSIPECFGVPGVHQSIFKARHGGAQNGHSSVVRSMCRTGVHWILTKLPHQIDSDLTI